jgi:Spy/CpxP family protein refolding chaperone
MEVSEFYFIVLPLGTIVGILTSMVFVYARKEELAQWRLKRLMNAHDRKRLKQKETYTKELANLESLLRSGSIDENTYEQLRKKLEARDQQNREETLARIRQMAERLLEKK